MSRSGSVLLSRRTLLARGAGAALFLVGADLLPVLKHGVAAGTTGLGASRRPVFLYGIAASTPVGEGSLSRFNASSLSLDSSIDDLGCEPVLSPDGLALGLASVQVEPGRVSLNISIIDTMTGSPRASGILILPDVAGTAAILPNAVFSLDGRWLCLVLAITEPTLNGTWEKTDPASGLTVTEAACDWRSHHVVVYFDVANSAFSPVFTLDDAPSLAKINLGATKDELWLWSMTEPAAMQGIKGNTVQVTPQLTVFRIGSDKVLAAGDAVGPWPVNDEPIVTLDNGLLLRLIRGATLEIHRGPGTAAEVLEVPGLDALGSTPAAATIWLTGRGHVAVSSPAMGRFVLLDPAAKFSPISLLKYPVPRHAGGAPLSKVVLSGDEQLAYVLGPRFEGGIDAYDLDSGAVVYRSSAKIEYTGLRQAADESLLAIGPESPRLNVLNPHLELQQTADVNLHIAAVF